jgi:hypothetical protein
MSAVPALAIHEVTITPIAMSGTARTTLKPATALLRELPDLPAAVDRPPP